MWQQPPSLHSFACGTLGGAFNSAKRLDIVLNLMAKDKKREHALCCFVLGSVAVCVVEKSLHVCVYNVINVCFPLITPFLCRMGRSYHRGRIQYVTRGEINKLLGQRQMLPTHRGRVQTLFKVTGSKLRVHLQAERWCCVQARVDLCTSMNSRSVCGVM